MLNSPICGLLGIERPLFQGGMAWISDAELAAAVSNAGGLGVIAAGNAPPEYVTQQVGKARELTDKPFAVNVMLLSPYADQVAQAAAQAGVAAVITGAGNPSKYMELWHRAGVKVIPVVPSTALAKLARRCGAAAVVAEGGESGGHVGEITTMALVPQVCDAVDIPVVAAGGIADGRGVAAAFTLGAAGVQVGTRFLVARECNVHRNYKEKILKARDIDTITTGKRLGHPVRSLKTPFSRAMFAKEFDSGVSDAELEEFGVGALRSSAVEGDEKNGCFLAGQVAGMVNREQTAREIIDEMLSEAEDILKGAPRWVR